MRRVNPCGGSPVGPHYGGLSQCWVWQGPRCPKGYGVFSFLSKPLGTHRVSRIIHYGKIPEGKQVLHRCDNPSCLNPEHLFLGDNKDNVMDRVNRGRGGGNKITGDNNGMRRHPERLSKGDKHWTRMHPANVQKGETHGASKLTESMVYEIRKRYSGGNCYQYELAKEYGVTKALISFITLRKIWKHI